MFAAVETMLLYLEGVMGGVDGEQASLQSRYSLLRRIENGRIPSSARYFATVRLDR